jgi:hypothetical protein
MLVPNGLPVRSTARAEVVSRAPRPAIEMA